MIHTPQNLKAIEDRFVAPYRDHLSMSGYDEMKQRFDGETLNGLTFPTGYAADRKVNLTAPLHEFGHFITLDEARCVRSGFGFRGGTPYVSCGEFYRLPTGPWSATTEGKAIAWEIIVFRDMFGVEPDYYQSCRSLCHSTDFFKYEGNDERQRVEWVAGKVRNWVAEFGSLSDFEEAWHARCERLPELFARETSKLIALNSPPVSEEVYEHEIGGDTWTFTLYSHGEGTSEQFVVDIVCSDAEGQSENEQFDRKDQALGWIDRTVELALESSNMPTVDSSPIP